MRKLLTFLLCAAACAAISAQTPSPRATITAGDGEAWWGYWDGSSFSTRNWGQAETYDQAVYIPANDYGLKGKTIKGIRFYVPSSSAFKDVGVWMSKEIPNAVKSADITYQAVETSALTKGKMNDILFDEPYTLASDGAYVGFSITTTDADVAACAYSTTLSNEYSNFLRLSTMWTYWTTYYFESFALAIQVLFEGDFPEAAAEVVSATDVSMIPNAKKNSGVTLKNLSPNGISKVSYILTYPDSVSPEKTISVSKYKLIGETTVNLPIASWDETGLFTPTITITKVNGVENTAAKTSTQIQQMVMSKGATKRAVLEEYTALWCPNCPRGIVGMRLLEKAYGAKFIGLAVHVNDDMSPDDDCYVDYIEANVPGEPYGYLNRGSDYVDPYYGTSGTAMGVKTDVRKELNILSEADIAVAPYWTDENKTAVCAPATVSFALSMEKAPYRLAYVLVADSLYKDTWVQTNGFAGNPTAAGDSNLSEFYNGSKNITGLYYNHVVVLGEGIDNGIEGSISAPIEEGVAQTYEHTFTLPDNDNLVQNKDLMKVCVMLINTQTGKIVNAAEAEIADVSGISQVTSDKRQETSVASVFDLQGRRIAAPKRGVNVVRMSDGTSRRVLVP